jgi:hypothetical protein
VHLSDYHDVSRFSSKMPRPRDTPLDRWERISRVVLGFPGDRRLRHGLKLPATRLWSPEPGTTVHLVPVKFPGPDAGPLKKNARGTLIELRRRKQEIGWEKKQLDSEEANVDKAIALLEEEFRLAVKEEKEEEEDVEEEAEDAVETVRAHFCRNDDPNRFGTEWQWQCVLFRLTVKKEEEKNMEEDLVEEEDVIEEDEQDAMVALHFAITLLQKVRKELLALQQQQQKKKHEQLRLTVKKEEEKNMEEDLVEEEDVIEEDEMVALHFAITLLQKVRKELLALQQQQKKKHEQRAFVEAAAAEAAAAFDAGSWG